MSEPANTQTPSPVEGGGEKGATTLEYVMLLGLITAMVIAVLNLLYPSAGRDIESLVNAWGDRLARQIAGDKISKSDPNTWQAE
jgi:Flp pilus assembly pilin Flp